MITAAKPPVGTTIYVLTRGGQNEHTTTNRQTADNWLGLGEDHDYQVFKLEDYQPERQPTGKEMPALEMRRTQDLTDQARRLTEQIERQTKKFKPKSSLLQ